MTTPAKSSNEPEVRTTDHEIVVSRVFDAPREMVWEAMTDPKKVVLWWGPRGFTTEIEEMDVRPGGVWKHVMIGPDGTRYPNYSTFKEVVRPERIVFAHGGRREDGPEIMKEMTWTFDEVGEGRTRLTLRQVYPSTEMLERVVKEFGAIEGAKQTMARLEEFLAVEGEFVITGTFDAPRELIWRIWTEAEHIAKWWGPKGTVCSDCKLEATPGGMFHYSMRVPNGFEMWGKFVYREIRPPLRLVFVSSFSDVQGGTTRHPMSATWPLEALNLLTLDETDGRTTLTLRCAPVNASEEEKQTFHTGSAGMKYGLGATLDNLAEYIVTQHRTRRSEMNIVKNTLSEDFTGGELTITREFDAPRALVFRAWVDVKMLAQWWGPAGFTNPVCEIDPRPGGAIRIHMRSPDGTVYPMTGEFREIVEPERVSFATWAHGDEGGGPMFGVLNTVTFEDLGGRTKITLVAKPFDLTPDAAQYLPGMEQGWSTSIDRLAGLVSECKNAPK